MTLPSSSETSIVVPPSVRRRSGIKPGDKLKFQAIRGVIMITAKPEPVDDEYTPEQRRKVLRAVRQGLAEIKAGQYYRYNSVEEMATHIEAEIRKRKASKNKRRR